MNQHNLLQKLIEARGPAGQEDEVREICLEQLRSLCDEVRTDPAGNVIGRIRGKDGTLPENAIRIMAHMDEIAMIVKRINPDGTLRINNLGSTRPCDFGQGPVEILADSGILPGIVSIAPQHTTKETPNMEATKTGMMEWQHVHVFTGHSAEDMEKLGVGAGTRVVIARERRKIVLVGDFLGGYFMDDRAGIVTALETATLLRNARKKPAQDVYFVMTTEEERGGIGASYAARALPGNLVVGIEVGPASDEYGIKLNAEPVVVFGDVRCGYTKPVADRLLETARKLGMKPQRAVLENYNCDASVSKSYGQSPCAALVCIPTQNTHGYEIIHRDGIRNCARLLATFLIEGEGHKKQT